MDTGGRSRTAIRVSYQLDKSMYLDARVYSGENRVSGGLPVILTQNVKGFPQSIWELV